MAEQRMDGRTARAERTRRAIVDAHLALLEEGDLRPTGERIADRAGVSLRALWTNFKDMEGLFAAVGKHLMQRQLAAEYGIEPNLALPQRLDAFSRRRAHLLELIAPAARAARLREPFSAQLRRNKTWFLMRARDELEGLFKVELDAMGADRAEVLDALVLACTFTAWSMLRDDLGLSVDAATAVMKRTVGSLLHISLA
jgi:TetR/AcrR family transcriptional regulator of autoinduction and epiphytic fitness